MALVPTTARRSRKPGASEIRSKPENRSSAITCPTVEQVARSSVRMRRTPELPLDHRLANPSRTAPTAEGDRQYRHWVIGNIEVVCPQPGGLWGEGARRGRSKEKG